MNKKSPPKYFIQSFERGLLVLETFAKQQAPLRLSEVASLTNMGMPTAKRYILTLQDLKYVRFNPLDNRYSLTIKAFKLGYSVIGNIDLKDRVQTHLHALNQEFDMAVNLAILADREIFFVDRIQSNRYPNLSHSIGSKIPIFCTSLGRAIIAFLERNNQDEIIEGLDMPALTPKTITDKEELRDVIKQVRKKGYAFAHEEYALGWANYAVPIFNMNNPEGALGISFPINLLSDKNLMEKIIKRLIEAAEDASI